MAIVGMGIAALLRTTLAAEAALNISPSRVVLQGRPKQTLIGFFTLENTGDQPVTATVEPEDWTLGLNGRRGPVAWLTVRPAKLTVRPGKRAKVKYTIRVPADANGELRTQVFFTTALAAAESMRTRTGAILYVAIEGTEHIAGGISRLDVSYSASTPGISQPDRLEVLIGVANESNVHIVPEGTVLVRDVDGHPVATITLAPGWGLLPHEEDAYHAIGNGIYLKSGLYTLEASIVLGGDLRRPTTVRKTVKVQVTPEGQIQLLKEPTPEPPPSQ